MSVKKHAFHADPLLLILLAVVFSAAAVIFLRVGGARSLDPLAARILGAETPSGMMRSLGATDAAWDTVDFSELKIEAKGL